MEEDKGTEDNVATPETPKEPSSAEIVVENQAPVEEKPAKKRSPFKDILEQLK